MAGTVEGKVYSPGIDPLNPGDAEPIDAFSDTFEAQRVIVNTSASAKVTNEDSVHGKILSSHTMNKTTGSLSFYTGKTLNIQGNF